jgi:hypothetical protein
VDGQTERIKRHLRLARLASQAQAAVVTPQAGLKSYVAQQARAADAAASHASRAAALKRLLEA